MKKGHASRQKKESMAYHAVQDTEQACGHRQGRIPHRVYRNKDQTIKTDQILQRHGYEECLQVLILPQDN